jgi:hypothetical protein
MLTLLESGLHCSALRNLPYTAVNGGCRACKLLDYIAGSNIMELMIFLTICLPNLMHCRRCN